MKYGILGDIHGNLNALETVLAALEREDIDQLISVGDVVGYGAAPSECIGLLREAGAVVVMGNHDAACIDRLDMLYFNPYAREAALWTRSILSEDDRQWLGALPLARHLEHCSVAHGTLFRPDLFDYIQSPQTRPTTTSSSRTLRARWSTSAASANPATKTRAPPTPCTTPTSSTSGSTGWCTTSSAKLTASAPPVCRRCSRTACSWASRSPRSRSCCRPQSPRRYPSSGGRPSMPCSPRPTSNSRWMSRSGFSSPRKTNSRASGALPTATSTSRIDPALHC